MHLSHNLKFLRESRNVKQDDLAQILNVSVSNISKYENGSIEPPIKILVKCAKYYEVSLDDLVLHVLTPPIPLYASNTRYLREQHGYSQEHLAGMLNIKRSVLAFYETGQRKMDIEILEQVADFFNIPLDQLVKQDLSKGSTQS